MESRISLDESDLGIAALVTLTLDGVPEALAYKLTAQRFSDLNDPLVRRAAEAARAKIFGLKMRLLQQDLLITVERPWCVKPKHAHAQAKVDAFFKHQEVRFQGFHCAAHAGQMHEFCFLDANMHCSCCEQVLEEGDFDVSMSA